MYMSRKQGDLGTAAVSSPEDTEVLQELCDRYGNTVHDDRTEQRLLHAEMLQPYGLHPALQSSLSCPSYVCGSAGSDRGNDKYGASSSDSEDEALEQLRTTSRRPSTNYRPEFAAKTLAQVG